jgi:hypothetical protein
MLRYPREASAIAACVLFNVSHALSGPPPSQLQFAIAPLLEAKIKNRSDVEDDIGKGEPSQVFARFLHARLPDQLVAAGNGSLSAAKGEAIYARAFPLEQRKLRAPRGRFRRDKRVAMRLPIDGTRISFKALTADLVLFFEDFTVRRGSSPGILDGPNGITVRYDSKFAIWDNRDGRVFCFGYADGEDEIIVRMQKESWEKAMKKLADSIVEECSLGR